VATIAAQRMTGGTRPSAGRRLTSLDGAATWFNSPPLSAAELSGRIVLVNFWTYTCINWLRQLPHVRAWAHRYRDQGLVVIGVHCPAFAFEHDAGNVRRAVERLRVDHPVVADNEFRIWRAFGNHYWPALHFVDRRGRLRHAQFGENEYESSEHLIQDLLAEPGRYAGDRSPVEVFPHGVEEPADWPNLKSPDTLLGLDHADACDRAGLERLVLNHWALNGAWTRGPEEARLDSSGGQILYRFHARDVHLVMAGEPGRSAVRFRVRVDGRPPGDGHGTDVGADGHGTLIEPRLYQLVRRPGPVGEHTIEITYLDPGARVFAFAFG
jgi:thiol-disulfide isomerase/thioredoxin